jgi:5-formyltetrahydrofolate cyclo-ligase
MDQPDKQALRAELRLRREELAARNPDADEQVAARFPIKLLERFGPVIGSYWAIGTEIDPVHLEARLKLAGGKIALPRLTADQSLRFHLWSHGDPLEEAAFGLKQPLETAQAVEPTLVLVPLLGFDAAGYRIGYGKGYFDRYLGSRRAKGRVFACGLAHRGQQVEALPSEPHDQRLDWVVTELGSIPLFLMNPNPTPQHTGEHTS